MNACPPAYRNLSPTKECALRSIRLATNERPGALPGQCVTGGGTKMRHEEHRARVFGVIRAGMTSRTEIGIECGNNAYAVIDALVADGEIVEFKDGRKRSYAVAS